MGAMSSQITDNSTPRSTVCSGWQQRKSKLGTSGSWPVDWPHKAPVIAKASPCQCHHEKPSQHNANFVVIDGTGRVVVGTYPWHDNRARDHVRHGPFARYVKLWVTHASGMPGAFSPPPWVGDPDMHHGTCVTPVSWCIPGSLTSGFLWSRWRGTRSRHSRRMRNPQFSLSDKRPMKTWAHCVVILLFGWLQIRLFHRITRPVHGHLGFVQCPAISTYNEPPSALLSYTTVIIWIYIWPYGYRYSKCVSSLIFPVARDSIIMYGPCWWSKLDSFCVYLIHKSSQCHMCFYSISHASVITRKFSFVLLCLTRVIRYQKNLKNKMSRVIFLVLSGAFSVELNWDELNISSDVVVIVTNHWEWASRLTEWNLWHKFSHADKFYVFIGALFDQYIQAHIRADQILKPTHKSVWCNLL